jgi:hypothetical protein
MLAQVDEVDNAVAALGSAQAARPVREGALGVDVT